MMNEVSEDKDYPDKVDEAVDDVHDSNICQEFSNTSLWTHKRYSRFLKGEGILWKKSLKLKGKKISLNKG